MTQSSMWAVRWECYGADGVITTEGGGSIGMSREIAAAWKNTDSYKYYVISIEEALALREKYPAEGARDGFANTSQFQAVGRGVDTPFISQTRR